MQVIPIAGKRAESGREAAQALPAHSAVATGDALERPAARRSRIRAFLGNALLIGGGVAVSVMPAIALSPTIFVVFLIGHLMWTAEAIWRRDGQLIALNAGMAVIDVYAIYIRL